jgi:PHS family inorganic phosphate transporter-like MFS transporter
MVFVILLVLCHRFWLGVGIGGDYPLSATIMSEYANKKTRGAFIAAVFAMQGFGILGGAAVSIIISAVFRHAYPRPPFQVDPIGSTPHQADYVWRIIFMFGALPAALTFYYRMKMPETARYTALVERNDKRAAIEMGRVLQVDFGDFVSTGNMNPVAQRGIYSVNILSGFGHSILLIETVQDSSLIKGFL